MTAPVGARPVVLGVKLWLSHVPDLVRHGSKTSRDLASGQLSLEVLYDHLRPYAEAVDYMPNQIFIGNEAPDALWELPQPWAKQRSDNASADGRDGGMVPQTVFYGLLAALDHFDHVTFTEAFTSAIRPELRAHRLVTDEDLDALGDGESLAAIEGSIQDGTAEPLHHAGEVVGCITQGHPDDVALGPDILLENLAAKVSAVIALRDVSRTSVGALDVDYVFGCGEEAIGDRYQRGGGNLAKAVAEDAGAVNASGSDIKAFCCAPNHAIAIAAGMVRAGIYTNVAVVGGGALAKLGMKYAGAVKTERPILEDVLASVALIIGPDDGVSPYIDLGALGKHDISSGSSAQAIAESLVVKPLQKVGLALNDVDHFATELHNPEITVPQGSGDVAERNYRVLAAMAVRGGEIDRSEMGEFARTKGMPGFSPTQGHIASAVPYLGHARHELTVGSSGTAFFYAKGSLFLGRMTKLSDGFSFLLRRNNGA